jgi:hypothetical protein
VPDDVAVELDRIERRRRQLPLHTAEGCADRVRTLAQHLADAATPDHRPRDFPADAREGVVPDLGPATLMDQLRVVLYDVCLADAVPAARLTEELARVRRELP